MTVSAYPAISSTAAFGRDNDGPPERARAYPVRSTVLAFGREYKALEQRIANCPIIAGLTQHQRRTSDVSRRGITGEAIASTAGRQLYSRNRQRPLLLLLLAALGTIYAAVAFHNASLWSDLTSAPPDSGKTTTAVGNPAAGPSLAEPVTTAMMPESPAAESEAGISPGTREGVQQKGAERPPEQSPADDKSGTHKIGPDFSALPETAAPRIRGSASIDENAPARADVAHYIENEFLLDREQYAEKVDYYDHGLVSRDFVLRERHNYMKRWPMREYKLGSKPVEVVEVAPNEYVVHLEYTFAVANRKTKIAGRAHGEVALRANNGAFEITRVKEVIKRGRTRE